jgi:cytochrome b561
MPLRNTSSRYGSLMISLHWLTVLLLIGVYACIELRELYPRGSDPRELLKTWHFMLGLSVFSVTVLRLCVRGFNRSPAISPLLPPWQDKLSRLMHLLLYLLILGLPIGGWLLLSAAGKPIPFFGLELPPLIAADKELAKQIKYLHETGGLIGYYLIGFHALAALFHHYLRKDDTLLRMLPRRR